MPHAPAETRSLQRRRRGLLLAGASLVALGVALNVDRFSSNDEPTMPAPQMPDDLKADVDAGGRGEEGKMGRAQPKSGLYAMKGEADEDVWGGLSGTEVGEAYGAGGLGIVGTGRGGGGSGIRVGFGNPDASWGELPAFRGTLVRPPGPIDDFGFTPVQAQAISTFSIDVDTASYSAMRRTIRSGRLPEADTVRVEELVNYFDYGDAPPSTGEPFAIAAEVGECPWNPAHRLVRVGLQAKEIATSDLPPRNLVFLVDVSGSMMSDEKLPLVKRSLARLTETLRDEDRISIVVYAGAAGLVLPPTSGADKDAIHLALGRLRAAGGTNGGEGLALAYAQARKGRTRGAVSRVILATDGDFNVGVSSHRELVRMIERERKSGVELSVLGYGMGRSDHTMEALADKGNGNYAYIDGPEEADKVLVEEAGGTLVTVAKDVKLQVRLDPARVRSYRLIGYDNRKLAEQDFADDTKDAGEIGAGHDVTALYEVVPTKDADEAAPWMTVDVRFKPPGGDRSASISVPVDGPSHALEETSDDFRFSAAVAGFGMLLRGSESTGAADFGMVQRLALGALGEDFSCRRHELAELVASAARLSEWTGELAEVARCEPGIGEVDDPPPATSEREPDPPPAVSVQSDAHAGAEDLDASHDRWPRVLEVLRLLPPLLALPLFVMALRRPRRRR